MSTKIVLELLKTEYFAIIIVIKRYLYVAAIK